MAEDTRPLCKCHGEPMLRASRQANGNPKWACRTSRRQNYRRDYWERGGRDRKAAVYRDRVERGVCRRCEGPLTSEALCWDCLTEMEANRALYL